MYRLHAQCFNKISFTFYHKFYFKNTFRTLQLIKRLQVVFQVPCLWDSLYTLQGSIKHASHSDTESKYFLRQLVAYTKDATLVTTHYCDVSNLQKEDWRQVLISTIVFKKSHPSCLYVCQKPDLFQCFIMFNNMFYMLSLNVESEAIFSFRKNDLISCTFKGSVHLTVKLSM